MIGFISDDAAARQWEGACIGGKAQGDLQVGVGVFQVGETVGDLLKDFARLVGIFNGDTQRAHWFAFKHVHALSPTEADLMWATVEVLPEGAQLGVFTQRIKGDRERTPETPARPLLVDEIQHQAFTRILKQVEHPAGKLRHASPQALRRFRVGA
ncbi:MAG: hypothetical protein BWX85_01179 [Chloroflexi bacterium ADurb.Bin120]|nr:MAG: hypothetical protein BWX85_01179 [Chloroflexi bacterium ADurb.Bin120]